MYTYNLSVAMANRQFSFRSHSDIVALIEEAIRISNSSCSATRQKRIIEYHGLIDDKHIYLIMKSQTKINPTRSLSSLSRAFISIAKEKNIPLTDCISYSCVFNTIEIEEPKEPISIDELTDSVLLKSIVDLVYSGDSVKKTMLKEFMLQYINASDV